MCLPAGHKFAENSDLAGRPKGVVNAVYSAERQKLEEVEWTPPVEATPSPGERKAGMQLVAWAPERRFLTRPFVRQCRSDAP